MSWPFRLFLSIYGFIEKSLEGLSRASSERGTWGRGRGRETSFFCHISFCVVWIFYLSMC